MKSQFNKVISSALLATAMAIGGINTTFADGGSGHAGNPGIIPPQSKPYGKSYGEWATKWWQWVMSIPADRNPLTDETGEFADEGQSGPVWFAAGTFGNSVERSYSVPEGKALFVPVDNWIFGAGAFDCDPTVPGVPCVVCELQALAAANTEAADIVDVMIDGQPVENVRQYRASSPKPFSIHYPENSVTGVPEGNYYPNVADGYWLMLEPLAKGKYEIVIHVRAPETSYGFIEFVVIQHIEVTRPN
jgi:hypothetical protein